MLLNRFDNVNSINKYGETALIRASLRGHKEVTEFLITKGADKNIKDQSGKKAIEWANENGHIEIKRILTE